MSSVEKRTRDGKVTWLARWRDPDGRQRKRTFGKRSDADRFVKTVSADVLRGRYVDPSDATTFRAYAEQWRAVQVHRPTTRAHTERQLRRHAYPYFYPYFGDRKLGAVLPSEVQAWVAKLSGASMAPSSVQLIHGLVSSIFKAAVRDRKIASGHAAGRLRALRQRVRRHGVPGW